MRKVLVPSLLVLGVAYLWVVGVYVNSRDEPGARLAGVALVTVGAFIAGIFFGYVVR